MLRENKQKIDLAHLACYFFMAIIILPTVDYFCSWYVTMIPVLTVALLMSKNKKVAEKNLFAYGVILFILLISYWGVQRRYPFFNTILEGIIAWTPCIFAIYLVNLENTSFLKKVLQFGAFLMMITSVTTIVGLNAYPQASRELASGTAVFDTAKYSIRNIGGYSFVYGIICFLPISLWMIKHTNKGWKALNIAALVINLVCIYQSQYTLALIVTLIVLLFVLAQKHPQRAVFVIAVIGIFMMANGLEWLSKLFAWASEAVQFDYVSDRLLQVSQLLSGSQVHTATSTGRLDHYRTCLRSFANSPVWGTNLLSYSKDNISGHSFVLDILAGLGILGAIANIVLFSKLLKNCGVIGFRKVSKTVVAVIFSFMAVSIFNPSGFILIYFVLLVCTACVQRLDAAEVLEVSDVRN